MTGSFATHARPKGEHAAVAELYDPLKRHAATVGLFSRKEIRNNGASLSNAVSFGADYLLRAASCITCPDGDTRECKCGAALSESKFANPGTLQCFMTISQTSRMTAGT